MISQEKINYDPAQEILVQHLGVVQKNIEEYEHIWLKHKDVINLRNQIDPKKELNQPKYTQTKPKVGIFRSFLFESMTPEIQAKEEIEGIEKFKLIKESKSSLTKSNGLKSLKPNGLYAYGGPGCGKTFLMDLTFDLLNTKYKVRMHYNEFMLRVHQKSFNFSNVFF